MRRISQCFGLFVLCISLCVVLPLPVSARSAADLLIGVEDAIVTRGDFIRAAVQAQRVNTIEDDDFPLPYKRIPRALFPYVSTAHARGALAVFREDLLLAQGITRGQALRVLVELGNDFDGLPVSFRDVRPGTDMETAVRVAVKGGWMNPLNDNYFGVNRMLTVREGRLLLRKMAGEGGFETTESDSLSDSVPTVKITFQRSSGKASRYPLPKTQILETIWRLLNEEFLYAENIDPDEAAYRAAEALVQSLDDPYTTFLRPTRSKNFQTQIKGEVSGIGAQVEHRNGILTIVAPLKGSPAEKARLQPGDEILSADDESLQGMDFLEAVDKVRGLKGSSVKLLIRRNGIELTVTVVRNTVKVPEIEISWQRDTAVVQIMQFGRLTDTELRKHMADVQEQNPTGLVLDLRNNPGGLLHAAQTVLSNFLPKGSPVAKIKKRTGEITSYTEEPPTININVPVVVLVNAGSASASEIVAGALQDAVRATIIGENTFGKGTVQQVLQFNDDSSLKMSIAEWMTPIGRKIEGVGLKPDIFVKQLSERDEQMLKALDILRR